MRRDTDAILADMRRRIDTAERLAQIVRDYPAHALTVLRSWLAETPPRDPPERA